MLLRNKHFSLLDQFVSYEKMKFCEYAPWPASLILVTKFLSFFFEKDIFPWKLSYLYKLAFYCCLKNDRKIIVRLLWISPMTLFAKGNSNICLMEYFIKTRSDDYNIKLFTNVSNTRGSIKFQPSLIFVSVATKSVPNRRKEAENDKRSSLLQCSKSYKLKKFYRKALLTFFQNCKMFADVDRLSCKPFKLSAADVINILRV
jgi:hypothetical protein